MIRHCVMCHLAPSADLAERDAVMQGLGDLVARLEGLQGFQHGPNLDLEDTTPDHRYGFTLDAEDRTALAQYADHPAHRALGARLVALCQGGKSGIRVYDLEV